MPPLKTEKTSGTFRQTYRIECEIKAPIERVWALLTDASRFPVWNSTVTRIEGEIALGNRLAITVPLAPGRTFKPRVTAMEPKQQMTWSDGFAPMFRGVRTFRVTTTAPGLTGFAMAETFSGLMFPMIKGSLPDFTAAFESYAADLKRAAEGGVA